MFHLLGLIVGWCLVDLSVESMKKVERFHPPACFVVYIYFLTCVCVR